MRDLKIYSIILILTYILLTAINSAFSQITSGQRLDKIIAIVGDEIIMESDLNSALMILTYQNPRLNPKDPSLRKQVLDNLINTKLMIAKAIQDSITVSEEEVNQYLDFWISEEVRRYGSEKRLEDVYGISITRLKLEYRDEVQKRLLAQKLQQQKFANVTVTQKEVEEFFEKYKDSIPEIPDQVELYHIVKEVEAITSSKSDIFDLAKRVRDSIIAGGDFADFARRYSADPGTRNEGGNLGWFERGKLYPEYEKAAFNLQVGEVSLPVETPFGFHIIQTLDKKKDAVLTRHILFQIGLSNEDIERTKKFLSDLAERVKAGENFEELAKKYSDDKETKGFGGFLGKINVSDITSAEIVNLPVGGITPPMLYKTEGAKTSYHIVYKKRFIPKHTPKLPDDYKQIEKIALFFKQEKLFQEWIEKLKQEIYWVIKE